MHCDHCSAVMPKASLRYMMDRQQRGPGRHLCETCYQYYRQKPTTQRTESREFSGASISTSHENQIRKNNAAAKRGGKCVYLWIFI